MFQVEPILWLQAYQAGWFFDLMTLLSWLGEGWLYTPLILLLAFAGRMRPALALLLAMALTGAVTDLAKAGVGLPRPSEVDARVTDKNRSGRHLVEHGGAPGFLALPSRDAIAAARARTRPDHGFISGHTSAAAAFALSLALGFGGARRRWILLAIGIAAAMGLSRMHLGRHFLADVLGGLMAGLGLAWWVVAWMRRLDRQAGFRPWWPMLVLAAVLVVASLALGMPPPGSSGYVVGALLCIAWLQHHDRWSDAGRWWQRLARGVCVLAVGHGVIAGTGWLYAACGWSEGDRVDLLSAGLGTPLLFVLAALVCGLLRLQRGTTADTRPG